MMDRLHVNAEPAEKGSHPPRFESCIVFQDVWFAYDLGDAPVLRGLSIEIPGGSFTALIGESGVGKTTVADLVLGLHQPQGGQILIDGKALSSSRCHGVSTPNVWPLAAARAL